MRETDRKMREVFARFDNLSRRFGDLGNRLGEFVEAMVEPALVDLFRARGLDVSEVHRRVTSRRGGERIEIDLLVVDGDTAVAVECKSRLTKEEVERHVERMNKFKRLLPRYADMRVHGAVAGMVVDEDAIEAAQAAGLWVLAQSGETVALRNDPDFTPRVW
jgi:Holliday junction resolvase-like predicted endonuclease